jgi:hypothetical protein
MRRPRSFRLEQLESRCLLAASYRPIDGHGNNQAEPTWGAPGSQLLRQTPAAYADGFASPAGLDRPSARLVSNVVMTEHEELLNARNLSDFIYVFGQFIDHDLGLTLTGVPGESLPISVPADDAYFDPQGTGTQTMRLTRSAFDPATGTGIGNPRQQTTVVTSWLDGSMIYGSDAARAAALRTFSGGQLQSSDAHLLPLNTAGLANQNRGPSPNDQLFLAGDIRANENIELTALHVLFLREHNRLATQIQKYSPQLGDQEIYERARQFVIGELQSITFNEFLPALLGDGAVPTYSGYQPTLNPGVANEFAHAAFRVGHTFLGNDVEFLDDEGYEVREEVPLSEAFFNPALVRQAGIDPILKYLASDKARESDMVVVDGVRNFLFGPPGAGGFDLVALDIQRGRDHGLADYNSARAAYGLPRVEDFDEITSDEVLAAALEDLYGDVDQIDLFVGGLAENHAAGASVGPLFQRIIADQFSRVRDGDRFWYQYAFSGSQLDELERTTLADILRRNTALTNLQPNVFFFDVSVSGRVFADADRDGAFDSEDQGLGGRLVYLSDEHGMELTSTLTAADGSYRFDALDSPGDYRLQIVPQPGEQSTSPNPATIRVTRGMSMSVDLGVVTTRVAGDVDGDGDVDLSDFGLLKQAFGQSGDQLAADLDGNGQVDLTDFGQLKSNFGIRAGAE